MKFKLDEVVQHHVTRELGKIIRLSGCTAYVIWPGSKEGWISRALLRRIKHGR